MDILVSMSGGIDSTVALAMAVQQGHKCHGVSFKYGSKHNQYENRASQNIAQHYAIESWRQIDLSETMRGFKSHLMKDGGDIPEGHYEDESMSQTVVPARNIIFSSILAGLAWSIEANEVWLGIHAGDHAIYPDCRPAFFRAMKNAVGLGTDNRVTLQAPLLHYDKGDIVELGRGLKAPFQLTRTCYKDQEHACGKCGSCQERLEAFKLNDLTDPIEYEKTPEDSI